MGLMDSSLTDLIQRNRDSIPKFTNGGDTRTFQQYDNNNAEAQRMIGSSPVGLLTPNNPYRAEAEQGVLNNVAQAMTDPMMAGSVAKVGNKLRPNLPPNSIVSQINGLDGKVLGYEIKPHNGTPQNMHEAALENARTMANYADASNSETIHLVTDATGKPVNRINARFGDLYPLD